MYCIDTTKEEYSAQELIALLTGSAKPSKVYTTYESDLDNESYEDMVQRLNWLDLCECEDLEEIDWSEFSCPIK